jgi:hypothetical protein
VQGEKLNISLSGHPPVRWSDGGERWQLQFHCCCFSPFLLCHAGRVIATDNGHDNREKVVFVETRVLLNAYIRKLEEN